MIMTDVTVYAPLAGRVVRLQDLPDPVFSQEMVGPGLAIDPQRGTEPVDALSPLTGTVGALHPHAYAVETEGAAVLVHLGLDTVTLDGAPFDVAVDQGERVRRGQVMIRWNISQIGALSPLVPVVALGATKVEPIARAGEEVEQGSPLFRIVRSVT